ncbi:RidA family protein [Sodalis endosymbiont of Spalangia cameroni]|uniref:RidA family protein n=1 Tax=Sodalis praecaptivus TaxID=1239307 RepID=UPI0031FA0FF7
MTEISHVALQCITAPDVPPPAGHYSHAVKTGNWVFVSGVLPVTVTPEADFAAQTEAALRQCQQILAAAGCGWPQVAQCTAYIVGITHWPVFNQCYAHFLQHHKPARAVVPVPALHHGYLIEIQLTAVVTSPQSPPLAERHRES